MLFNIVVAFEISDPDLKDDARWPMERDVPIPISQSGKHVQSRWGHVLWAGPQIPGVSDMSLTAFGIRHDVVFTYRALFPYKNIVPSVRHVHLI